MIAPETPTPRTPVLWTPETLARALTHALPGPEAKAEAEAKDSAPAWEARGVSINSRTLVPGDLFVALKGDTFDGHDFVAQAFRAGACAALVSRPPQALLAALPEDDRPDPARLIAVPDTLEALAALGRDARARFQGKVVGVTGSVGKTGTKDMLTLALGSLGRVFATTGNLNNHIGVPLTLARMPQDADFAVVEMGMNHPGEIGPLSRLARPHVAVITAVAAAHLEHFDSLEAIADAKGEILEGLEPGGALVLNHDTRFFERICRLSRRQGQPRVIGFGQHIAATARLLDCALDREGTAVLALVGDRALSYRLGVEGRHWARNSLAVLGVILALGLDLETAARSLAAMTAPRGRGRRTTVPLPDGGSILVIDESYNANPESMAAALTTLSQIKKGPRGRHIAVLGDMLELGVHARSLHAALARTVLEQGTDLVHTAGPLMEALTEALPPSRRGIHAADAQSLAPRVLEDLKPGDVVMVKGSNGSRVGQIVTALCALAEAPAEAIAAATTPNTPATPSAPLAAPDAESSPVPRNRT